METINQINDKTEEGRLLLAALCILTTSPGVQLIGREVNGKKIEPDVMLKNVSALAEEMYPGQTVRRKNLADDLRAVINKHSVDNDLGIPDFIFSEIIAEQIGLIELALQRRRKFFS